MRFLTFLVASLAFLISGSTYAQSCYSQSLQSGALQTVYPQTQTFTTVHTVNVPTQVTVQHTVQSAVQPQVQQQVFAAPMVVPQCSQNLGAVYGSQLSTCGNASFGAPLGMSFQSYGNSFNSGLRVVNNGAYLNNSLLLNGATGGSGVSISARDRRGTAVQATGVNNVRVQRDFLGRIKGATADTSRRGLAGLLPF